MMYLQTQTTDKYRYKYLLVKHNSGMLIVILCMPLVITLYFEMIVVQVIMKGHLVELQYTVALITILDIHITLIGKME